MGQHNLERMMQPQHIAVVGASERSGTIGDVLMKNLLDGGFSGQVMAVNPEYQIIHGKHSYRSVSDLDLGIDLAVIATPLKTVPKIILECINRKVGGAIVISADGNEEGEAGREIEHNIRTLSESARFRVIGPNSLGVIQPGNRLNASLMPGIPVKGNMAFVSQSGAVGSAIVDLAVKNQIGFSHFVSIGSMVDVDFGDIIDYLGSNHTAKSILLYIENLTNIRKFMSAARSISRVKPIIVLRAGKNKAGTQAASSHPGAMIGEDPVYDAAFKRAGIVRVNTLEELFDCAEMLAKQPRPKGSRLALITNGGGPGLMAADYLAEQGFEPAPLTEEMIIRLDAILPSCWNRRNPIDISKDANSGRYKQVLETCLRAKTFDGIFTIIAPQALVNTREIAEVLVEETGGSHIPVFACFMGGDSNGQALDFLHSSGIPAFATPERAVQAFLHMVQFVQNQKLLLEIPARISDEGEYDRDTVEQLIAAFVPHGFLPQKAASEVLAAYGLPMVQTEVATSEHQAAELSRYLGFPVAIRLFSSDISHNTEVDGVRLDVRSEAEAAQAYREIMASVSRRKLKACVDGVTIQPYVSQPDFEFLLGAKLDRNFGPVVVLGSGGIYPELLNDKALGLPPLNRLLARRLIQETKAYLFVKGYRNHPPVNSEKLENMVLGLSQLLVDFPQITELDINPVLIKDGRLFIVNARILVAPPSKLAPFHLVISPYPNEYEDQMTTADGKHLFVRPVKPEDGSLFAKLFRELSPTTIYFRFFGASKELPSEMLSRFVQIDYDREIALVAIDRDAENEKMLGVARIIGDPDGEDNEFAVLVGDVWHGQGIGACLLKKCLLIAIKRGFKKVRGVVLNDNKKMLALGKKLGFVIRKSEDPGEFELQFDCSSHEFLEKLNTAAM